MRRSDRELLRFLDRGPDRFPKRLDELELRTLEAAAPDSETSRAEANGSETCISAGVRSADTYLLLLTRATSDEQSAEMLAHAAICDACGNLLAKTLAVFEGNPSPEEAAAIAEMAAQKDWQTNLAARLAATPVRQRPGIGTSRGWLVGGAIAAGLVVASAWFVWQQQSNTPERQLARAYSESRTLELRIPDAKYAGLTDSRHTRGTAGYNEPAALLEARAHLARELEKSPQDMHWLGLEARANLLEERYNPAIESLDRLIALGPATAEMLTDAGSAYFERGLVSGNEGDRSKALDYLRRADEMTPADPVVLFNEAIVMEDRGQMMNAVEVWNRYVSVERDAKWAAEGKRKMAALEVSLNRLKTHQSRLMQNLATPQAMEALAKDSQKLATIDEELTSIELDKVVLVAFPTVQEASGTEQARGSPCSNMCQAARRLLKALAVSLEQQHHDYWLSDLLFPEFDSLPPQLQMDYSRAMRLLAQATREDQTGLPTDGSRMALEARTIFEKLEAQRHASAGLRVAARVGVERAAVEYLFGLQRSEDFRGCRDYVLQLPAGMLSPREADRYPWIGAVEAITQKVCDDTPETLSLHNGLQTQALNLAQTANYPWLLSRIRLREADDFGEKGDSETSNRIAITTLKDLLSKDSPPIRIANTISQIDEDGSSLTNLVEISLKENLGWWQLSGSPFHTANVHLALMPAEMRIGNMPESERQLSLAKQDFSDFGHAGSGTSLMAEKEIFLADAMLGEKDLAGAAKYLSLASQDIDKYSDSWGLRTYASALGMLELAEGHPAAAAKALEKQILTSEGNSAALEVSHRDEYIQLDHDLYAELVAAWLAQGRRPEQVLALWERFRLRSRGLHAATCFNNALDCDQGKLLEAQSQLGGSLLIGQIVLLDRVLIYRMDRDKIQWSQKLISRQDLLDRSRSIQEMASSPKSTLAFSKQIGARLSELMLPNLPDSLNPDSALLLEPDPALQNVPWPLVSSHVGPIGLSYPLTEVRSILAFKKGQLDFVPNGKGELIVGASVAAGAEDPLPEVLEEAKEIGRFFDAPDLLLGDQATSSRVVKVLGSATLFHFAGHAIQGTDGTELLLASSSRSKAKPDVEPWIDEAFLRKHPPRACRLAVLSACATGGEAASELPLQNMVETLSSLGVPQVVATRWAVDSQASVPFMHAFYRGLGQGKSVAAALQSARQSLSAQPKYNNPYYWGAYYATGVGKTNVNGVLHASR